MPVTVANGDQAIRVVRYEFLFIGIVKQKQAPLS